MFFSAIFQAKGRPTKPGTALLQSELKHGACNVCGRVAGVERSKPPAIERLMIHIRSPLTQLAE
jgi:hypothetical protein